MNNKDESLKVNMVLFDKYKIIKILGKGGNSFVYLVQSINLNKKEFVLKEFFPHEYVNRDLDNMLVLKKILSPQKIRIFNILKLLFIEEIKNMLIVTTIKHEGISNVFEFFKDNNSLYIIMDYEETITLEEYILIIRNKTYYFENFFNLMINLLSLLEHIHNYGIYHQDIKMENIRIKNNNKPILIDFGSSVIYHNKENNSYFNTTTPIFAAIEQLSLNYPPNIDDTTDIYILGTLFYKILTGRYPVNVIIRQKAIENGFKDPYISLYKKNIKYIDNNILKKIDKSLNFYQESRYQTAKEFKLDLIENTSFLNKIKKYLIF